MRILFYLFLICSFLFSSENLQKVSVQLEWKHQFEFAGFYAAIEKGYYKDIGLEVDLLEYESGMDIIDDVISEKTTFGLSSSSLLLAKTSNLPVVLLASYFKQNVLALVTQKDIINLNQLKNKKIMATSFEMSHSSIGAMIKESKLSLEDVDFIEHDFSIEKFKNKEVDAMSVFLTNQLYLLDKNNIEYNIFTPQNFGLFSYDLELFTSENFAKKNHALVKNFVEATKRGWEYAFNHKKEIIDLIYSKYSKRKTKESLAFEAEETEKLFKRDVFSIGSIAPELIKLNYDMYMKLGLIKDKININNLIDDYVFNDRYSNLIKYDFTKEELKYLKSNLTIKVQNEKSFPPYNYLYNNKPSGFSIEYMKLLASKVGLNIKYESDTWEKTLNQAKTKKIDILLNTAKTKDRLNYLEYLEHPYIQSKLVLLVNSENKDIQTKKSLKDLEGKTIAVVKGYFEEELLKKYYPKINILSVLNPLEALKAVSYEKADGTLFGLLDVANYYINKYSISNVIPSFDIKDNRFSIDLYIALSKDNDTLKSILNKIQNNLDEAEILSLKNKIFDFYEKQKAVPLTINQTRFLKNNKTIKICSSLDSAPIEFRDDDGKYSGISIDILNEIGQKLDIEFDQVYTNSWDESQNFLKEKKCDILPAVVKTQSRDEYIKFTSAYLTLDLVVITTKDKPYINGFDDISNKILAKKIGSGLIDLLKQKDKNIKLIQKKTHKDSFLSVANGESYATITTLPMAYNIIKKYNLQNLQIAGYLDMKYKISMGVAKDNPILYEIINNSLNSIPKRKIKNIFDQWTSISITQQSDYSSFYKIIFTILFVLLFFIYWNNKLSREKMKAKKAMKEANAANKIKSQFLANMSHEVRTPMNGILGMLHLALETKLTPTQRDYLEKIDKNAKSLLNIMNDILDISKIEAGKLSLKETNFNLKQMVNNVLFLVKDKANEKKLSLNVYYEQDLEENYFADSLRLSQILTNLLHNGIKFTQNGKIELRISSVDKNRLRFEVNDTGIGISKEDQEKLFDSFFQVDETDTRKYGGSGLGLSICKNLVDVMNGDIWVESKLGRGSKFIFEVDVKKGEEVKQKKKENISFEQIKKQDIEKLKDSYILLVEDNHINQEIVIGLLEKREIKIDIANNGKEAVDMFKDNPSRYQLILMDIQMPVMDGYEASKQIREYSKDIPIIALTASAMQSDIDKTKKAMMNYHLKKPLCVSELYEVLVRFILNKNLQSDCENEIEIKDDKIPEFEYIDAQEGLKNVNNNKTLYMKILNNFKNDYEHFNATELDNEEFKRVMHTLKGLTATIGASSLNLVVLQIEKTNSRSMLPIFYQNLDLVIQELESKLPKTLKVSNSVEKKDLSIEKREELFEDLKKSLALMEPKKCKKSIASFNNYLLNENEQNLIDEIKNLIENYDFDEALKRLK